MDVIPIPLKAQLLKGSYHLPKQLKIICDGQGTFNIAQYTASQLSNRLNINSSIIHASSSTFQMIQNNLLLKISKSIESLNEENIENKAEGYVLTIKESEGIKIEAIECSGLFYGIQSLLQLLPFKLDLSLLQENNDKIEISCVKIVDAPRFKWRGVLLDVGRHFYKKEFIKIFLDVLAMHKINRFHWHLTEDQGWRIEIKAYPKLTKIGSWRQSEDSDYFYGGFYTQEEIIEVVKYAKERYIEIIPEIEMPGHCGASLASYPHLSCTGKEMKTPNKWGIYDEVYCAGKDEVFEFLKTVLEEIAEMFPYEYIHIGGDECPKIEWKTCTKCQQRIKEKELEGEYELQTWFINEISKFLKEKNKKIIGWDEIMEGGIPEGATVMSWRGYLGGFVASKLGHDVIMSPTSNCYIDYKQSSDKDEPGAWYAVLPLDKVYEFEPIPTPPTIFKKKSQISSDSESKANDSEMKDSTTNSPMDLDYSCPDHTVTDKEDKNDSNTHMDMDDDDEMNSDNDDDLPSILSAVSTKSLTKAEEIRIIGGQVNLWTEYVKDEKTCEYMLLPRLCAFSEAIWSPKYAKDWEDFKKRLIKHVKIFDFMNINYKKIDEE